MAAFLPVCASGSVGLGASAFAGSAVSPRNGPVVPSAPATRRALVTMAGNRIENRERREVIVNRVKAALQDSQMVLGAPLQGLTVAQLGQLKDTMPEGTKIMAVKNTLLRIAVDGDEAWGSVTDYSTGSNMWFFVQDDIKGTVEGFRKFVKDSKSEIAFKGGVLEGVAYDTEGVAAVSKLPTKKELYQKIAISVKAVPTKVAKGVKAVPTKVGRAINLAVATEPEDSE